MSYETFGVDAPPTITVDAYNRFTFPHSAFEQLGKPAAVALHFDKHTDRFGISVHGGDVKGKPFTVSVKGRYAHFYAGAPICKWGIGRKKYDAVLGFEDNRAILWCDL
jgi:hypothetical protein